MLLGEPHERSEMIWKVFVFGFLLFPTLMFGTPESLTRLKVPSLYVETEGGNHYLEEIPESKECNVLLARVISVIKFANSQFEDRRENWPPEFIAERLV